MSKQLTLNNNKDIVCNSLKIIDGNQIVNIRDLFLTKSQAANIVGIPPDDLNTLQEISQAVGNDANFFQTIDNKINLKRNITDSYTKTDTDNLFTNYYNKAQNDDFLNLRYTKTETNNLLNNKANTVDVYGKLENDSLLSKKLDTTTFNTQIALKANVSDVYTISQTDDKLNLKLNTSEMTNYYDKQTINTSLNLKVDKSAVYSITDVNDRLNTKQNTITDNSLLISHVNNLQGVLNAKQNTITDNSLSISHVNLLQGALNAKQNTIDNNSLSISHVNNLQSALDSKQQSLTDLEGNGVPVLFGNKLRKVFGSDGIDVTQFLNLADENDPSNFQIRVSGSAIFNQLNSKLNSSAIDDYYKKADVNGLLNAKQNTIGVNGLAISNINLLQGVLDAKLSSTSLSNYYTKAEIIAQLINFIKENTQPLFSVLNIKHGTGINLCISSSDVPTSNEVLLSLESASGVTINTHAHVENNLTIGGNLLVGSTNILNAITDLQNNPSSNVDLSNYFTKSEINSKISNYIYQHVDEFFSMLYLKHSFGIEFFVNNMSIMSLLNNSVSINKNTTITGSLTVGSTNILTAITNLQNFSGSCVLNNVNNSMTSNITTTGNIQSVNLTATGQLSSTGTLSVSGACSFNNTLAVSNITNLNNNVNIAGTATLNGAVNINNACNINKGRGTYGNGGSLRLTTLNNNSDPCALAFVLNGVETHIFEFSWLGLCHFMKLSNTTTVWTQTAGIDRHTGQWKFYKGLLIEGACTASSYVTSSDSRLKTQIEDVPAVDSINLLKNVSAKTYKRINDDNNKREIGFIAQDFENLPISLGENFVDKFIGKISPDGEDMELKTMAYDRVPAVLWTVCKNLLNRIEVLEAKLNST